MKLLINRNSDGAELSLEDKLVLKAFASGGIVNVQYLDEKDGYRKSVEVSNTLAQIGAISDVLTATADIDGTVIWINKDRVTGAEDVNGLAVLKFDSSGAVPEAIKLNITAGAWQALVIAKEGDSVWNVIQHKASDNSVLLVTGFDISGTFTAGDLITLFSSSNPDNNGIYEVASAVFESPDTRVLFVEDIVNDDPSTGYAWKKA